MTTETKKTTKTDAPKVRTGMLVQLSPETLASIDKAAKQFSTFGLTQSRARAIVTAEIERLSASVSATDLFAAEVQKQLAIMQGAG